MRPLSLERIKTKSSFSDTRKSRESNGLSQLPTQNIHNISMISRISSVSDANSKVLSLKTILPKLAQQRRDSREHFIPRKNTAQAEEVNASLLLLGQERDGIFTTLQQKQDDTLWNIIDGKQKIASQINLQSRPSETRLSPRTSALCNQDIRDESPLNRDISNTLEPIINRNFDKMKKVNDLFTRRAKSLGGNKGPRSKFEEEVMERMATSFLQNKMSQETRTLKENQPERFILNASQESFFKIRTEKLVFPIEFDVEFMNQSTNPLFEVYASSIVTKPTKRNFDYRFTERSFSIRNKDAKWLYFSIFAITNTDVKFIFRSNQTKRGSEQRKRHSIQSSQLLDSYRKSVERIKEKSTKLYPFLKYNADQMTDFVEEIKRIKQEKVEKNKSLAKDGRDIVSSNLSGVWKMNREYMYDQINNNSERRDRSIELAASRKEKSDYDQNAKIFLLRNKEEIRQKAREGFQNESKKIEVLKYRKMHWLKMIATRLFLYELGNRISTFKYNKLIARSENRAATKIQKTYREYIQRKEENSYKRLLFNIRGALNSHCCFGLPKLKGTGAHVMKSFLSEAIVPKELLSKFMEHYRHMLKIQKLIKRYILNKYLRLICFNVIIKEHVEGYSDEKKKRKRRVKDMKKKEKEKEKEKEEKDLLKAQLYQTLQANKDLRVFVGKLYIKLALWSYRDKYREYKIYKQSVEDKINMERQIEEESEEVKPLVVTWNQTQVRGSINMIEKAKKQRVVVIDLNKNTSKKPKPVVAPTKNTNDSQPKKVVEKTKPELKILNREAFCAFLDERCEFIVQRIKEARQGSMAWLVTKTA